MKKAVIDLTDCKYIMDLHRRIKIGMNFPDWYGMNWSAFWDMINKETDCEFITVKGSNTVAKELKKSVEIMKEIMERNKQFWKDKCPFDYEFID